MNIIRDGRSFSVVDDAQTRVWDFWENQFARDWERPTLDALSEFLDPERDYLDIGAWVGPTVLWGAPLSRRCVAVEPDPAARSVLRENVRRNCPNVTVVEAAVAAEEGTAVLETGGDWGDSMSSLQRRKADAKTVSVRSCTLLSVLANLDPAVVKIDIEGGEEFVLPPNEELLHDLGCPILLGLHWPWITDKPAIQSVLDGFKVSVLDDDANYPTVLCS